MKLSFFLCFTILPLCTRCDQPKIGVNARSGDQSQSYLDQKLKQQNDKTNPSTKDYLAQKKQLLSGRARKTVRKKVKVHRQTQQEAKAFAEKQRSEKRKRKIQKQRL